MPCEVHSAEEFKTYLCWMRENVEAALKAHTMLLGGKGDWLLNSALGLLVGAYSEALGKVLDPQASGNRERFQAFADKHLMTVLQPDPEVESIMRSTLKSPFKSDEHFGVFAFWTIYRNGFAHDFAPATALPVEFRWGRHRSSKGWIHRKGERCVGDAVCQREPVDIIDLNLTAIGQAFLKAAQNQQEDWEAEVAESRTTWKGLLEALRRK